MNNLKYFKNCADDAPDGTYHDVKALNEVIGNT